MNTPYVKISLIVPLTKKKRGNLMQTVKKFPVVANFKPKEVYLFAQPTKNEKFMIVDVYLQ